MKRILGPAVCLLTFLFLLTPNTEAKAAEKALLFPIEFTTNNESKNWDDNISYVNSTPDYREKTLSTAMKVSFDAYVPKSLMATSGMTLSLSPSLGLFDKNWQWDFSVNPQLADVNISKSGSGYRYTFYDQKAKKEVSVKKYVSIKTLGKYIKVSVKNIPLQSTGKTDSGKTKSTKNLKKKLEFQLAVVGTRKAKAMLYLDNILIKSGKKTLIKDSFNKDANRWMEMNRIKESLLYIDSFNKNKIPKYKKVPDDIRNASAKNFVSRTSKKATTATIKKTTKNKAKKMATATYKSLPNWHGVNLTNMYEYGWNDNTRLIPYFTKDLVDEIAKQGFNFLRVTLDSRMVYSQKMTNGAGQFFKGNDKKVNLNVLKNIDDLITWCVAKKIHVCLDLHNAPGGYMIGGDEEASRKLLFEDGSKEQQYFYNFWKLMTKRYKGISSNAVSFNLYNEPPAFATDEQYSQMMKKAIKDVHSIDKDRLIFVDMLDYGKTPVQGLVGEPIVQSSHIYDTHSFTHSNYDLLEDIARGLAKYSTASYEYDLFHGALVSRMEEIKEFREKTGTLVMMQEFGCDNYIGIKDMVTYYNDILSLAKEYSLSWATWDYASGTFGYVNTLVTERIPGAHYVKIGDHRYVAKEVRDVLRKYMK